MHQPIPCGPVDVLLHGEALASFIAASPTTLAFGDVPVGDTAESTLTLETLFSIRRVRLLGIEGDAGFSLVAEATGWDVGSEGPLTLSVRFTPTREGPAAAVLCFSLQEESAPLEIPLSATAVLP